MRFIFIALALAPLTAHANPTTQACLGNLDTFLTCPAGAQRQGNECRAREPQRGQGAGEHWSGSKRQGPSLYLRKDGKTVSWVANYKDHKKTGRVFRFDQQGRLETITDLVEDKNHGINVMCTDTGQVKYVSYFKDDRPVFSRAWKADGSLSYAFEYDDKGQSKPVTVKPELAKRPDHLCRPQKCDVKTPPELWK